MDIDCENRCGDRKKKGVNLMTGAELIKWIQESHSEGAVVIVWEKSGLLKNADTFSVRNIIDGNDDKHIAIVIE